MTSFLQVTTVADTRETASHLARTAVAGKFAAGAYVAGPVLSFFWHLGEQGESEEWHVILKTTEERYAELEAHLLAEHPWKNPEISAIAIATGSAEYLRWIERTVS